MTKAQAKESPTLFGDVTPPANKQNAEAKATKPVPKTKRAVAVVSKLPAAAPPPEQPKSLLAVVMSAAADPRVDVPKMKELLAMSREIELAQQQRDFNTALHSAQSKMPRIVRDRENEHTRSKYATLEKVSQSIDKIVHAHGFSMAFGMEDSPLAGHYRTVCDLSLKDGATRRYHYDLPADTAGAKGTSNKTAVQGIGSTTSYARRYLKIMIFDLAIVGEDTDGRPREMSVTAQQLEQLIDLAGAAQCPEKKICDYYRIKKLSELPAIMFDDAIGNIRSFEASVKARAKGETP